MSEKDICMKDKLENKIDDVLNYIVNATQVVTGESILNSKSIKILKGDYSNENNKRNL